MTIGTLPEGRPWIVRPLRLLHSHQTVVISAGVTLLAKRDAFHSIKDCLLSGSGLTNVSIIGEIGAGGAPAATLRMRRADYSNATPGLNYTPGEWRHGIKLENVSRVTLRGLRVTETGGDGLYLRGNSSNVLVEDCLFDHSFRQGLSIVSAVNFTARRCTFSDTGRGGYMREDAGCGVDLEVCG